MKQDEFYRHLAAITPDMPEHFSNHVDCVLEKIMQQGEKEKSSKAKTILFAGVYVSKRALIVAMASLIMLFATVAFAATQWHIFENLSFLVGEKIPDISASHLIICWAWMNAEASKSVFFQTVM